MNRDTEEKLSQLLKKIREERGLLVAFSGGVDSSFVVAAANEAIGSQAVALTAVSPSLPHWAKIRAIEIASAIGIRHILVESNELNDPMYTSNPRNRCYYCKKEKFGICRRVADELGIAVIADGTTVDDVKDFRPGREAAYKAGIWSPLVEYDFTKDEVRELLRERYRLPVWNHPPSPCLASRFPYGIEINEPRLKMVEAVEDALRKVGIKECRARFHGDIVRIETRYEDASHLLMSRDLVIAAGHAAGFRYVTLDLEPFRSGRLNE